MLTTISPSQVIHQFGLGAVTYCPRVPGARLHAPTANFLASVGLPENKFFSPRLDLENGVIPRLYYGPSLQACLARDGIECPPGTERWEVIGGFIFAMVALDPENGTVHAFSEGEPEPLAMHADVSSLVHSLMVLERSQADYREIDPDDDAARDAVVARMRQEIVTVDPTPFAEDVSEWSNLFEEINLGMWG
ncbi:SUKH-4 family immunity protein [Streptomyces sp. NRRL F-5193]|uniref:SUKH-4 family immunity protein n=1 Tax=Streptomyces sp. NRRL F-5193 TaxID=1463860 RepID=UPI00068D9CC6|nr:SUKH-4 family immunity protein [Streptomyces sp. NRRL F-5193]